MICALVEQRTPRWVVYEDTQVVAFLPLEMEVFGHTVVAPKVHYPELERTPADLLARIMEVVQRLSVSYRERVGAEGFNLLLASGAAAQQSVPHLHFHLMPRFAADGLDLWPTLPGGRFDKDAVLRRLGFPTKPRSGWGS